MDIVDLDKVLDDFEFNEQNSGNPLNAQLEEECQQEVDLSNNNELVLPPVEILANSITNDNCTNNVKPSSRNMVLGYPLKSNLNSPIVFTNIIEYINTGTNQLSLEKENSDIVIDRNVIIIFIEISINYVCYFFLIGAPRSYFIRFLSSVFCKI